MDIQPANLPKKIQRAAYAVAYHYLLVNAGVKPSDVVDPDFWVHVARHFAVNDRVEVVASDGSFEMELRVMAVDPRGLYVNMRPTKYVGGEGVAIPGQRTPDMTPRARPKWPDEDGYTVEWAGPHHKFRIVNGAGELVEKEFATDEAAVLALTRIKAEKRRAA